MSENEQTDQVAHPADPVAQVELGAFLRWLVQQTDEVLAEADTERQENESLAGEAVNWADLKCVSAEVYRDSNDQGGYRVYIDEVSPDAHKFRQWVRDRLQSRDIQAIEVITEW